MKKQRDKWQKELHSFLGIKGGFILEGNIHDDYPIFFDNGSELELFDFDNLDQTLISLAHMDTHMIFVDPLYGFYCYAPTAERQRAIIEPYLADYQYTSEVMGSAQRICYMPVGKRNCSVGGEGPEAHRLIWMSEIIRRTVTTDVTHGDGERQKIFVLNFASRLERCNLRPSDSNTMFMNLQAAIEQSRPVNRALNTVVMVVEKYNDIPAWLYLGNPNIHTINIAPPGRITRRMFLSTVMGVLESYAVLQDEKSEAGNRFVAETEGYLCKEIRQILELAYKEGISSEEIQKAFQLYKYGVSDNPWDALEENISEHIKQVLEKRVKGQPQALKKVENMAMRAVKGLSGLQHSNASSKPRGILFFAGPTGVGKTEMAKALAQSIFGDESACIRFDMSEYRLEQSDQKLFGAPPGYVGYEGGGQLTNAVKERPFSVLLFDEIEKASPTIMDKFLQILEDGRMTDNQGNTVYFGETIIIFTSNIGLTAPVYDEYGRVKLDAGGNTLREATIKIENPSLPDTEEFKEKVSQTLKKGVIDYFTNIGRPELLNRLGKDNIVVYQFIDKEAAELICEQKMKDICKNLNSQKGYTIVYDEILPYLKECAVLERGDGGRGVGNMLESKFLNELTEYICEEKNIPDTIYCRLSEDGHIIFEGRQ